MEYQLRIYLLLNLVLALPLMRSRNCQTKFFSGVVQEFKSFEALAEGFLPSVCSLPYRGTCLEEPLFARMHSRSSKIWFHSHRQARSFLDTRALEEKKIGVKGLGRRKTDEKEHFFWKDDIKVPCGKLIPSELSSVLEYNEYAVYDPQQV
ncbi:hypothetical protein HAX54_018444 [Datura stramonium]|uniref:Poly [ADP-ribose] polymerase n=1 Tax=Datura stramonium TaxID=4076 RepID=A0ABS8UM92_DATST|nr:hypothetical protein [Datura stramonium]